MSSGCGCKEVYRFPHITYPYSSCICSFLQQLFVHNLKKCFLSIEVRSTLCAQSDYSICNSYIYT